ncbi:MAG: site-specific integrase, partial [bacterium]|nr:site-specific integrase [bacterium]
MSELAGAHGRNVLPAVASLEWGNDLTGRLRQKLAEWGYVAPERQTRQIADRRLCKAFFEAWIESRTDLKWRTRNNYMQAVDAFLRFAGSDRLLADVTQADADSFRLWMLTQGKAEASEKERAQGFAASTVNKHLKRMRTLFAQAARAKLIPSNPMTDLKIGTESNRERDYYVDGPTSAKFLKWCGENGEYEWALIFALARFAGLRPCEMLVLTWRDIDWAEERLRIDSPKTGLR